MELVTIIIFIFIISFIATLLSSMSGGGASIIAIPGFLYMGIPFPLATAIQHVSASFWVLPAAKNYLPSKNIDWKFLVAFSMIGLIGAIIGIKFILHVSQRFFELLIGSVILFLVIFVYFKKEFGTKENKKTSRFKKILSYPFALLMGFYESIFGSGNGIFFSAMAIYLRGFVFRQALGYYYVIVFPWVVVSAILLMLAGFINIPFMISGLMGSTIGGYIGSQYAALKGNKFIKILFCLVGLILSIKLLAGI